MLDNNTIQSVLSAYPNNHRSREIYPLTHTGLSGTMYWKVDADAGTFCLRRWPCGIPSINQLQYIQAVLWHAVYEGFDIVPLPCETSDHKGFVSAFGSLWELLPWIAGSKDLPGSSKMHASVRSYSKTEPDKVVSAMITLAQFHEITSTFPLPNEPLGISAAVQRALFRWKEWIGRKIELLFKEIASTEDCVKDSLETELLHESRKIAAHFATLGGSGMMMFSRGSRLKVPIQPSIGNANRRHFLFDSNGVCGMIDFKEMGADSVAYDIATLLGSMVGNDPKLWCYGIKAYQSVRPLSCEEQYLAGVLDFAEMILSNLRWLDSYFLKKITFQPKQMSAILENLRWQNQRLDDYRSGTKRPG